ncbi:hypothetical protein [Streptomyces sp. B6B3]
MSTAPQPTTPGSQNDSSSTADQLREKVKKVNAQSEANRLSKGGK